jgi:hypothetical protein
MPDEYPYFTDEAIEVATEAVRAEAKKWFGFSDRMSEISTAMAGLTLEPSAFAVIDISRMVTSSDQSGAYDATQQWLTSLFKDASGKMDRFGDALNKNADEYDRTDGMSAKSFDTIANEL